jgi:antitoxin component YwqK of YwqJK toxin-antitoxin module
MKTVVVILSIVVPFSLFAQPTKKVTRKTKNRKEVYSVIQSDKTIRHGSYQMLGCGDQVYVQGHYKNGLKDSAWREYDSHENYREGKRIGVWEFYFTSGELEQKYDYSNNTLLYYWSNDSLANMKYKIIDGSDTIEARLDRPLFNNFSVF